jgi:hypothetical protein
MGEESDENIMSRRGWSIFKNPADYDLSISFVLVIPPFTLKI